MIVIKIADNKLRALIRGQAVRPAQQHRDRRKEPNRRRKTWTHWRDE